MNIMASKQKICLVGWDSVISDADIKALLRWCNVNIIPYNSDPIGDSFGPLDKLLSFATIINNAYSDGALKIIETAASVRNENIDTREMVGLEIENIILQYTRISGDVASPFHVLTASRLLLSHYIWHIKQASYDAIICSKLPHLYVDYIFCIAAQLVGIPRFAIVPFRGLTRTWEEINTGVGGYFHIYDLNHYKRISVTPIKNNEGCQWYCNSNALMNLINSFKARAEVASLSKTPKTQYLNNLRKGQIADRALDMNSLHDNSIVNSTVFLSNLKRSYDTNSSSFGNPKRRFLFFPLHKQPEASTNPSAGNEWSQEEMIARLSSICIHNNIDLLVKEHPDNFRWCLKFAHHFVKAEKFSRAAYAYSSMTRRHVCLRLLSLDSNPDAVVSHQQCIGVATTEGSTGISALIHGKAVILLGGDPWYSHHQNCMSVSEVQDIPIHLPSDKKVIDNSLHELCENTCKNYILYVARGRKAKEGDDTIGLLLASFINNICRPSKGFRTDFKSRLK